MDTMFDDATAKLEKHGLLVSEVDSQYVGISGFCFVSTQDTQLMINL